VVASGKRQAADGRVRRARNKKFYGVPIVPASTLKYQTFELPNNVFDCRIRLKELGLKSSRRKRQCDAPKKEVFEKGILSAKKDRAEPTGRRAAAIKKAEASTVKIRRPSSSRSVKNTSCNQT
jgi:hypothetical protein